MAKKKQEKTEKKIFAVIDMLEYKQLLEIKARTKLSIADLVRNGIRRLIADNKIQQ